MEAALNAKIERIGRKFVGPRKQNLPSVLLKICSSWTWCERAVFWKFDNMKDVSRKTDRNQLFVKKSAKECWNVGTT
ncbi:hypothetical protein Gasu2_06930 [Galdieria sulphuraria]|nr:hypothetical protein Gasu2_06930 [Galdieria sulphuraria]